MFRKLCTIIHKHTVLYGVWINACVCFHIIEILACCSAVFLLPRVTPNAGTRNRARRVSRMCDSILNRSQETLRRREVKQIDKVLENPQIYIPMSAL